MSTIYVTPHLKGRGRHGECTCAGAAPGFPQHETDCGWVEPEVQGPGRCCGWTGGTCEGCPGKAVA